MSTTSGATPLQRVGQTARTTRNGLLDLWGRAQTRGWISAEGVGAGTIRPDALPGALALYAETFGMPGRTLARYARLFPHLFYVVEDDGDLAGYCCCYVRPAFSPEGLAKRARIYSFAVDPRHRRQGVGRRMRGRCMAEMARNGVAAIDLYVDRENLPAIALYTKFGMLPVEEVPDVCGDGKDCYRLERTFAVRGSSADVSTVQ